MKALIIGGGIAGLAAAISLRRAGWNALVEERSQFSDNGIGFIILPNGLNALDSFGVGQQVRKMGKMLNRAIMRKKNGEIFKTEEVADCLSIKRSSCIDALRQLIPEEYIHTGCDFSHFEYDETGKAIAAHFKNGVREEADIFIGADGVNSRTRKLLFPDHTIRQTKIKELVGFAYAPEIVKQLGGSFIKTHSYESGLAMGLVPCNNQQLIWFIQLDNEKWSIDNTSTQAKKDFVINNVHKWPAPIQQVLKFCDFEKANLWPTRDMDLLPSFHHKNILLMGDAAHMTLPFTSQGTNSALKDALVLGDILKNMSEDSDLETLFTIYYEKRKDELMKYLNFGREMENYFLHAHSYDTAMPVPLAK